MKMTKQRRELLAEQDAHKQTRNERDEAYMTAQYLRMKVQSLWSLIAQHAGGQFVALPMDGYSPQAEALERLVLQRATDRAGQLEEAPTEPNLDRLPSEEPPQKRQKRGGRKPKASSPPTVPDSSPPTIDAKPWPSSDGSVNPADLLFNNCMTSDTTLPSDPWSDAIDPVILAQQTEAARDILGELCECPTAQRIIAKAGDLTKDELERMKAVMESSMDARVDVGVFAEVLLGE